MEMYFKIRFSLVWNQKYDTDTSTIPSYLIWLSVTVNEDLILVLGSGTDILPISHLYIPKSLDKSVLSNL